MIQPTMAKQFLLLLLIGFVSASLLRRHNIDTDSEKNSISARTDVGALTVKSTVSRRISAGNNKGFETPARSDLGKRDPLAKRLTSPHNRRIFDAYFKSKILSSAFWEMDIWVDKPAQDHSTLWLGGDYSGSIEEANVTCKSWKDVYSHDPLQFLGLIEFILQGVWKESQVNVNFTAWVFATSTECHITNMASSPTCTLNGKNVEISSWTFDSII